jgi:hypothetical protein
MKAETPFSKFTHAMDRLVTVSHDELKRRLEEDKRNKARKKRAMTSPASRASGGKRSSGKD